VATALALGLFFSLAVGLAACGGGPSEHQKAAVRSLLTTTTTNSTTTVPAPTITTQPRVVVPDVIGLKIVAARTRLQNAGFPTVSLNAACGKGTLASQSVVSSLSVAGHGPDVAVGALPLPPGTPLPARTPIAITWSGCFGNGSVVPDVVGMTFATATRTLHGAGLTWACYSVGKAAKTSPPPTAPASRSPQTVLSQGPAAGTLLRPSTTVDITMHLCPK
jgi:beta-lactam-binding protein with PASTA domain